MASRTRRGLSTLVLIGTGAGLICSLAACSSGSNSGSSSTSTSASAKPIDPCSTLSAAEIQMALGAAPMGPGKRDNQGAVDSCTWNLPAGDLAVTFYNAVGAATFYAPTLSPRQPRDKTYTTISGVGDQAVYRDDSSPPAIAISESVEVVQKNRHFDVHYVDSGGTSTAPSQEAMMTVAKTVLGHAR